MKESSHSPCEFLAIKLLWCCNYSSITQPRPGWAFNLPLTFMCSVGEDDSVEATIGEAFFERNLGSKSPHSEAVVLVTSDKVIHLGDCFTPRMPC